MSLKTNTSASEGGWWETGKIVVQALAIAMVVRVFFFQPFNIPSGSMKDTLLIGDYLFVSKLSYGYSRFSFPSALIFSRAASSAPSPSAATSSCSVSRTKSRSTTSSASSVFPVTKCR